MPANITDMDQRITCGGKSRGSIKRLVKLITSVHKIHTHAKTDIHITYLHTYRVHMYIHTEDMYIRITGVFLSIEAIRCDAPPMVTMVAPCSIRHYVTDGYCSLCIIHVHIRRCMVSLIADFGGIGSSGMRFSAPLTLGA